MVSRFPAPKAAPEWPRRVCDERFDVGAFEQHVAKRLPEYARPVFLRIVSEIEMTATFKPKKQELVRASYDPLATTD